MPAKHVTLAANPSGTGAGTAVKLDPAQSSGNAYTVQFVVPGTATTQIQVSYDNVSWTSIGSGATGNSVQSLNLGSAWVRLNNTAWTSGACTAILHNRSPAKVYA
jgi:hypothetical protein